MVSVGKGAVAGALWLGVAGLGNTGAMQAGAQTGLPDAPVPAQAANPAVNPAPASVPASVPAGAAAGSSVTITPSMAAGVCSIQGAVRGSDGGVVPGATVELMTEGHVEVRSVRSDDAGAFTLGRVACGQSVLIVTMEGFTPASIGEGLPESGGNAQVTVVLKVGAADQVTVTATEREVAAAQIRLQEQQRLAGVLPNFFVSYQWRAAPLSSRQKFRLALRTVIDPGTFGINALSSGVQYSTGQYPEYGDGFAGFAALYGSNYGLTVSGSLLGGAVFPSLFHQDPRYFYKGTGSVRSRAWYAVSRSVITRGDNQKQQVNWSGILGNFAAGGASNLFVPPVDRNGAGVTLTNGLLGLGSDCFNNLMEEFVLRRFTTKTKGRRGKATETP